MFISFFLLSVFLSTVSADFACPPGTLSSPTNAANCYLFVKDNLYWLEAEQKCDNSSGHLVSIHNMMDNMFITQEALKAFDHSNSGDYWHGLSNIVQTTWSWIDSTPFDFVNWNDDTHANRTDAACGAVLLESGRWISDYCLIKKPFVCTVPALFKLL